MMLSIRWKPSTKVHYKCDMCNIKAIIKRVIWYIISLPSRISCPLKAVGNNCLIYGCSSNNKMGEVYLGNNVKLRNCRFYFEGCDPSKNSIIIGSNCRVDGVEFICRYGGINTIKIGANNTFGGNVQIEASEGTKVTTGEDCMFAHRIHITTTDHHSILNKEGKRVNNARDISIGNHVWIGMGVTLLKNSRIPNGSIVGANSTYTSNNTNDNSIFAGLPARMIKSDISWCRKLI